MDQGLKILILEDADYDVELIEYELSKLKLPLRVQRVLTREGFLAALGEFRPDLILADYRLPAFDGLTALALAQEDCPEVPFIFVSGAMSPDLAQEGLESGAAECIPKDRLSHLAAAVARSLGRGQPPATSAPKPPEGQGHLWFDLFQSTRRMMLILSLEGLILEFNQGAELLTGWSRHEVLGREVVELLVEEEQQAWARARLTGVAAGELSRDFDLALQVRQDRHCRVLCQLSRLDDRQGQPAVLLLLASQLNAGGRRPQPADRTRTFTVSHRLNLIC